MDKFIIEYQALDNVQLRNKVMAAVLNVLKESNVNYVNISQDNYMTGKKNLFTFAGRGAYCPNK